MLKSKDELELFLEKQNEKIALNNESYEKVRNYMLKKYEIPTGMTMDMIARNELHSQTEFILFCLLDGIDQISNSKNIDKFFTKIEIEHYSKEKYNIETIKFPIKIQCEEVNKDQWIGVTNTNFFMELRRAQLIRYNVNAQRVLKRIIKGENIFFKIVPNKIAIKAIKKLMKKREYVPTVITLNIPFDSDADFHYNPVTRELIIDKLDAFDISDGYHRYLAMCEAHDEDSDFNYPMELRIINFTDEKARQFIFQEDQKTKMTQSNSNSMNTNRPSNIVIDRLNDMTTFDFKGQLGWSQGTVNYASLSDIIEFFYFKNKKEVNAAEIRVVRDDIKVKFNTLSELYPEYITKAFSEKELVFIFYMFNKEKDLEKAANIIHDFIENKKLSSVTTRRISKTMLNSFDQLL